MVALFLRKLQRPEESGICNSRALSGGGGEFDVMILSASEGYDALELGLLEIMVACADSWTFLCLFLQPTDDIVLMAQTLEKIFLQKVASMPQEEQELVVTIPKNSHKKGAKLAGRKW